MYDCIVIGAGLAGATCAELLASKYNKRVLVIEKRFHFGGHCYDYLDTNSTVVQLYGPHILHTNNAKVWNYLSKFTDWYNYQHTVIGKVQGIEVPIPFNLNTLHLLLPTTLANKLEEKLIETFSYGACIPILKLKEQKDKDLLFLANFIYENIFLNYTIKQWGGMTPDQIDGSITERVPVVISKDDRYFQDKYQGIPKNGFGKMFDKMLNHHNIRLMLNTNFNELIKIKNNHFYILGQQYYGDVYYTAKIDELFDYEFGELPYRSMKMVFEQINKQHYQSNSVVNYPNNYDFIRITDFSYFSEKVNDKTTILREYPQDYNKDIPEQDAPYYIIPGKHNNDLYEKYKKKAEKVNNLYLVGRLANYKYFNMDEVVEKAMKVVAESASFTEDDDFTEEKK